jgi:hypothetical protein
MTFYAAFAWASRRATRFAVSARYSILILGGKPMSDFEDEIQARINKAIAELDTRALDRLLEELYRPAKSADEAFTPAIELKPAAKRKIESTGVEGDIAINWANTISRAERRIKYDIKVRSGFEGLRIVSEGDSWFQYPLLLTDIIDSLIEDEDKAVLSLDAAGDTVSSMVAAAEYTAALDVARPHAFLLSAGGNDLLGEGAFEAVLKRYTPGAKPEDLLDATRFRARLDAIMADYRAILSSVSGQRPSIVMLSHGYDVTHPKQGGKWLGKPLEKMGIPLKIGREIVKLIVDGFNDTLARLAQEFSNYHHVDLRGVVDSGIAGWYDELHPKNPGYERAAEAFRNRLRQVAVVSPEFRAYVRRRAPAEELAEPARPERFFCDAGGELEMAVEATISKPHVDRVEHTTHQSSRNGTRIDHIVIHYTTSRNIEGTISWFKNAPPGKRVSAHYIVGRDGALVQMVNDSDSAWHAGAMNARSIGIEHVAAAGDAITEQQAATSARLIDWLMHEYGIPKSKVIPHRCVKETSCCGDLFKAFGGGAGKSCAVQQSALHGWMESMGIPTAAGPEASTETTLIATENDRSLRGHHLADEEDTRGEGAHDGVERAYPGAEEPPLRASSAALRIAHSLATDRHGQATDDVAEFSRIAIGNGLDLSALPPNVEAAAVAIDEMFGKEELASFDFPAFEDFIRQLGIEHFRSIEFLYLGASNETGPCKGKNELPAKPLWPNIARTAQMLDLIRKELGAPIRILSAYRNRPYNSCISGAGGSFHMKFNAIDWRCASGTVEQWRAAARKVRARTRDFSGGIGFYPRSQFIHIDTRGQDAEWDG